MCAVCTVLSSQYTKFTYGHRIKCVLFHVPLCVCVCFFLLLLPNNSIIIYHLVFESRPINCAGIPPLLVCFPLVTFLPESPISLLGNLYAFLFHSPFSTSLFHFGFIRPKRMSTENMAFTFM